jgi:hypothetical protein
MITKYYINDEERKKKLKFLILNSNIKKKDFIFNLKNDEAQNFFLIYFLFQVYSFFLFFS